MKGDCRSDKKKNTWEWISVLHHDGTSTIYSLDKEGRLITRPYIQRRKKRDLNKLIEEEHNNTIRVDAKVSITDNICDNFIDLHETEKIGSSEKGRIILPGIESFINDIT